MSRIRSKDMAPEMVVRRLLYKNGYRYRLHNKELPGKPDIVFSRRKKIILVHGCFWHQHAGCKNGHLPKSNLEYWLPKLNRNIERDKRIKTELAEMDWKVLVVWECELKDKDALLAKLNKFLGAAFYFFN
ncbi:T/G mismatch-specific endonuclease [Nitrosomonas aestuarii]|uniref:Very short patch repair endonuclease n=1 Tax=Nitrosomonas aestuarii TaxID=52441 RepID=A0A1I4EWD7_9PROT|nr:DNA mismatch endonuclease Vsr [Nitrosomonas aestuarii]SFL09513.1 T/G mismatch-specific endonuclease [Nitrosomonas aestuarii]